VGLSLQPTSWTWLSVTKTASGSLICWVPGSVFENSPEWWHFRPCKCALMAEESTSLFKCTPYLCLLLSLRYDSARSNSDQRNAVNCNRKADHARRDGVWAQSEDLAQSAHLKVQKGGFATPPSVLTCRCCKSVEGHRVQ
jgi:hypothetical protein